MTAAVLFDRAFSRPRTPVSVEYRAGARYILGYRLEGDGRHPCPYPIGTAQADAWFAGCIEGHRIVNDYFSEQKETTMIRLIKRALAEWRLERALLTIERLRADQLDAGLLIDAHSRDVARLRARAQELAYPTRTLLRARDGRPA